MAQGDARKSFFGVWKMLPMWKCCQFQCCQWTMGGLAGKPFHEQRQNGLVSRLASHIQLVSRLTSHVRAVGSAAWMAAFPVRLTGRAAILAAGPVTAILAAGAEARWRFWRRAQRPAGDLRAWSLRKSASPSPRIMRSSNPSCALPVLRVDRLLMPPMPGRIHLRSVQSSAQ